MTKPVTRKKKPAAKSRGRKSTASSGAEAANSGRGARVAAGSLAAKGSLLTSFLASAGELKPEGRARIVDQALVMLEGVYAHLPLKQAMHGIDPLQRLRLLRHRLGEIGPESEFHRQLLEIFVSLRDLHTSYILPAPYQGKLAFLPFVAEEYYENGEQRYMVAHLIPGFTHPSFVPGVELRYWNGIPVGRKVELIAERHAGSNPEARRVRGVEALTLRSLSNGLPPDEEWAVIQYRTDTGQEQEIRLDWRIFDAAAAARGGGGSIGTGGVDLGLGEEAANITAMGLDPEGEALRRGRKYLFAPKVIQAERRAARNKSGRTAMGAGLATALPSVLFAQPLDTAHGRFGYVRIRAFSERGVQQFVYTFVNEFIQLIEQLPPNGLIVDVRDNPGGIIPAGEFLLQLLTPREIQPSRVQFINTPLTVAICDRHSPSSSLQGFDLTPWADSVRDAVQTGATYSRGFPVSPEPVCNMLGQRYHGPVVLITNAKCYSTTDFFAAGFQDHHIGPILGTDGNTGAGGANVWQHAGLLQKLFAQEQPPFEPLPGSPFQPLPAGADMAVSVRRAIRVRGQAGTPLEDLGVKPDVRHYMTRDDILNGNRDLIDHAGELLSGMPVQLLRVAGIAPNPDGSLRLGLETGNINRLDLFLDGRPFRSLDVNDGATVVNLPAPPPGNHLLEIKGYRGGVLVAGRKVPL